MTVWTAGDTVKVLQTAQAGSKLTEKLYGARNEFVSFQIMIGAPGTTLTGINPQAYALTGPHGARIELSAYHLYRQAYQNVTHVSDPAGKAGSWPDGLIPIGRDPIVGEVRNGAPFDVASGRNQALWVDLHIPASQPAGSYHGLISIRAHGLPQAKVHVLLTVWNFSLPSQSSLATAFGFDTWGAYQGHYGSNWDTDKIVNLTNRYSKAALQMRISMYGIDVAAPSYAYDPTTGLSPLDWTLWDRTESPANNGQLGSGGAKFTAAALPLPNNLSDLTHNYRAEDVAFWKAVAVRYRSRGWFGRSYFYYDDEPGSASDFALAKLHAAQLHQADPAFKYILTTHFRQDLVGSVNIWAPIINELNSPGYPGPAVHRARQKAGDKVWWYDSNSSADNGQWPDMFIDHSPMNQRIMGWMTWRYGLDGFLYYDTVYAYGPTSNPWRNVYYYGTNGDGTLFYPGKPSIIGGKTDIPCFSIRLMQVRQSLQDYEYMHMLKQSGKGAIADRAVNAVVHASDSFTKDPSVLEKQRMVMGQALSKP
jgi:hypothetical protein